MCNKQLWSEMLPYLETTLDLVYLDIPKGKDFEELANYYNDIIGNEKINLVGFSLGGYIATYLSQLYPERIEKLFVISNSPTCLPAEELKQRNDVLNFIKTYGYKGFSKRKIATMIDSVNHTSTEQTERLIKIISQMSIDLGVTELMSQYQYTSVRKNIVKFDSNLPLHTHFYFSDSDRLVNLQWFNELKNIKQNLTLINTAGTGHMLPLEKPKELANYINTWVRL